MTEKPEQVGQIKIGMLADTLVYSAIELMTEQVPLITYVAMALEGESVETQLRVVEEITQRCALAKEQSKELDK